jgi:membrane-associated protease RseP (regulator of RpoE activity)
MRRSSILFGLVVAVVAARPGLAQQALERLERELPLPAAGTQVGVPGGGGVEALPEEPGYLGILADETTDRRGVRLLDVVTGGPAEGAGMRVGDVLTSIDGAAINSLDELGNTLTQRVAGEKLAIVAIRGREAMRFDIVLGVRPPPEQRRYPNFGRVTGDGVSGGEPIVVEPPTNSLPPSPGTIVDPSQLGSLTVPPASTVPGPAASTVLRPRTGPLGVRVVRVTPELQLAMNLPEPRGALIVEVRPDSPARRAGLPVDAVIVAANGRRVEDPDELADIVGAIGEGGSLRVTYYRYGQSFERVVELETPPASVVPAEPSDEAILPAPGGPTLGPPRLGPPTLGPAPSSPAANSASTSSPSASSPNTAPAPRSVAEENERLRARVAELEALLKASQSKAEPSDAKAK